MWGILAAVVIGFLIVVVAIGIYAVLAYNRFINLKNAIESTFNQIRVAMKKRLDKITALVKATKSYVKYERSTLAKITGLRRMKMESAADIERAETKFRAVVPSIMAVMENYPDLKAEKTVSKLMQEVSSVEDEIARLRYLYNDQVQMFNAMTERFPTNIIASLLGFGKKPYLRVEEEAERPVDTSF